MPPGERWKVCYYTPAEPPTHFATLQITAPTPESALAAGNQFIREHHQANPAHLAATIEPDKETPRDTMNKQELIDEITIAMKITHCRAVSKTDVNAFLESLASVAQRGLRQEQNITLPGIGKFSQAPQMAGNTIIFAPAKALTITQK